MAEYVRLTHPESGGEFMAAVESVPGWEALGWQKAAPVKTSKKESA